MRAAIYCRVSTEDQESEGTSLQTQLDACLAYCEQKGYQVVRSFNETYSGLILERPKLTELRELIRAHDIDMVVVYCLDRLSRDPKHGVMLTQELEEHNVTLKTVTETVKSTGLGKLINYLRGSISKSEADTPNESYADFMYDGYAICETKPDEAKSEEEKKLEPDKLEPHLPVSEAEARAPYETKHEKGNNLLSRKHRRPRKRRNKPSDTG